MKQQLIFAPADDGLWEQYDQFATRAYGHPVGDITHLREHADLQVAVRGGRVVAGGIGLLVDQFFGGAPSPAPASATAAWPPRSAASTWPPTWQPNDCAP
ncbi:hypothetical protein ACFVTP_31590 [Streptomyces celluloflavus]|uniref:hypothetical protein n=1 Tax=Streptomyces celluloflavus TaxID=58344 RepID=UPI0036DB5DC0